VISDTHGLLRPEALGALAGSDVIIHAGDVGSPEVIERLRSIAPTFVVRGNNDTGAWAVDLPETQAVTVGGLVFWVLHEAARLSVDPAAAGLACVVSGHSHRPSVQTRHGILHINPGSAGPRRFTLPVTVARIRVAGGRMRAKIIQLPV
jgi:uncharacterized protein